MTRVKADPDELRMVVQRLARRIRANRADNSVSDGQLGVLFSLKNLGPRTPGQLAADEHITPPSINRTINSLEAAGWVTREPDPDDARRVFIRLTAEGTDFIRETKRLRAEWFTDRLAELDPAERDALEAVTPVLRKLAES